MILCGLAIFAGLSVNLILQFALGAGQVKELKTLPLFQMVGLFISVLFIWVIYTYIFNFLPWEFMGFFLLFPLSVLLCMGYECLGKRFFPNIEKVKLFSAKTAYEGLIPASLFLTVNMAVSFSDALVLSFFFACENISFYGAFIAG